jgi:hypothetical protein
MKKQITCFPIILQVTIKFFKNYKSSLVLHIKKFILEKLDCHLQYSHFISVLTFLVFYEKTNDHVNQSQNLTFKISMERDKQNSIAEAKKSPLSTHLLTKYIDLNTNDINNNNNNDNNNENDDINITVI